MPSAASTSSASPSSRSAAAAVVAVAGALCLSVASAARSPGSPFPVCSGGLNSSTSLFAFSIQGQSQDDEFTIMTLQGVLAKSIPRVYRYDPSNPAPYPLWLNRTRDLWGVEVKEDYLSDPQGLLTHFASELQGYVLASFDDNSSNVAVAAATAMNVVAVTPANEALATNAGLKLIADVRGKDLAWAIAAYNNTKNGFTFSPNVTVIQLPSEAIGCMSDYSIASGSLLWWQDVLVGNPLADQVLGALSPGFAMLGWGPDEYDTVADISAHGGVVVASNWASNMDCFACFDIPAFQQVPGTPAQDEQEDEEDEEDESSTITHVAAAANHTVAFLMSDGDNVQWVLDGFATQPSWYGSPDRTHVPMSWTLSPSLADVAPVAMQYLYSNAGNPPSTPYRDYFVAGVSGAGYFYPDVTFATNPSLLDSATTLSASIMKKADMRIVNVLAHGEGFATDVIPASYLQNDQIDAVIWYNYDDYAGMQGNLTFVGGKPVIGGRFNLWGDGSNPAGPTFKNVSTLIAALLAASRDPTSSDGYSVVPVHAWSHNVTDARTVFEAVQGQGVDVVNIDTLVQRVINNVQHPGNPRAANNMKKGKGKAKGKAGK